MEISATEKKDALEIMQRMIYASTEQQYMAAYEELNFPLVKAYFDQNWHDPDTRKQWATYHTKNFQNYLNRTTNRVESLNHQLKSVITTYGALHTFLKETMQCVESLNVERDHRTIGCIQRQPIRPINETETDFKYRSILTNFAFIHFRDEKSKTARVSVVAEIADGSLALKSHSSSAIAFITCTCPFYKGMSLPCRHIFFFLERKQNELFVPQLCHMRWLKSHLPGDLIGADSRPSNILTQNQKYHQANKMVEKIAELMAEKPMALFDTYMDALKDCYAAIQNHQIFSIKLITRNSNGNGNPDAATHEIDNINLLICQRI